MQSRWWPLVAPDGKVTVAAKAASGSLVLIPPTADLDRRRCNDDSDASPCANAAARGVALPVPVG